MLNKSDINSDIKMPSFSELGIDKARILRVIETLKVNNKQAHPGNIALELGIPRSYLYENLELLEIIYSNLENPFGHDKLIIELLQESAKLERKIKKLEKTIVDMNKRANRSFSDGFSHGASINFEKVTDMKDLSLEKEIWARSVLYIALDLELDLVTLKKAYRRLVGLIHPDVTNEDTNEMMNTVKEAYQYLLSQYN